MDHFIALFHVWGDVIQAGSHLASVMANLFDALRHIRHATGAFMLWIDALCTIQEDD